jgi:hypothetical protein
VIVKAAFFIGFRILSFGLVVVDVDIDLLIEIIDLN